MNRDGVLFDSIAERQRAWTLKVQMQNGIIEWWSYGPRYVLCEAYVTPAGKRVAAVTYRPDFIVREKGVTRVEDVKGKATREFFLKAKLWGSRYPDVELRIVSSTR